MMRSATTTRTWNWSQAASVMALLATAVLGWSYWPMFVELDEEWSKNPLYSHGYLVPVFAAVLLWIRRDRIPQLPLRPSWWALLFLATGGILRLGAAYYYYSWPDRISLLFMMCAATLAIAGWAGMRWTWPSILFLVFMIPFPGFVEAGLARPLQRIATLASTNVLQTLGIFAYADGTHILMSDTEMGVVEACSGLRMLSTFVALTVGACFFIQRPTWQLFIIILSAFPIAVLCNVVRITATGICYEFADHKFAEFVFHDVAGYLMMPLALLFLLLEFKLLDFIYTIDPAYAFLEATANAQAPAVPSLSQGHTSG